MLGQVATEESEQAIMGWGIGDDARRDAAKLQLSTLKASMYKSISELEVTVRSMSHEEKKHALLLELAIIHTSIRDMEMTLSR